MNILLYTPVMDRGGKHLYKMVEKLSIKVGLELHRSIVSLSERLRQPMKDVVVAIFYTKRKENLLDLLSIKGLLSDIRIILVLPDKRIDTIALGHTLRPSFMTYIDGNFGEVADVLNKVLSKDIDTEQNKKRGIEYGKHHHCKRAM